MLVFITALGFFITPSLLGGGRTMMAAMIIEQQADIYLDWPMASAIATVLLAMTLALYLLYGASDQRQRGTEPAMNGLPLQDAPPAALPDVAGGVPDRASAGCGADVIHRPALPGISADAPGVALVYRGLGRRRWLDAGWNSIQIGAATAVLSMLLGTLSALAVTRGGRRWIPLVGALIVAPMMLPHIIIAIGLYPTMLDLGLNSTYAAVVIGHAVVATPLVFITVSAALRGYDPALGTRGDDTGCKWLAAVPAMSPCR